MKLFAIRNKETKVLLSISCSGNSDTCGSYSCEFQDDKYNDVPWLTSEIKTAESAITEETAWYNSGLEQPENIWMFKDGKFQNYEVVEINLSINSVEGK